MGKIVDLLSRIRGSSGSKSGGPGDVPPPHQVTSGELSDYIATLKGDHPRLAVDNTLPEWPEVSLYLVHGYDCPDLSSRFGDNKGRFYVATEPGVKQSDIDKRLELFLRKNAFGDSGLNGNPHSGSFGRIGDLGLDIVHFGTEELKGTAYCPNKKPANVAIVDLGIIPTQTLQALQKYTPFQILNLTASYRAPDTK